MFFPRPCRLLVPALIAFACAGLWALSVRAAESRPASFSVLVFSKTLGYRHASIADGIVALRELGAEHDFAVEATEDSGAFTPENLARFKAVVFLSVTGDVLNAEQEAALRSYVEGGGGFVAIHGAMFGPKACEDQWAWYGEMMCATFKDHSKVVPGTVVIEDRNNPSTAGLPERWRRTDEWYNYTGHPRGCAHILATMDESTYEGGNVGADHPIAWSRQVGKGRFWFTALGHTPSSFAEPLFRRHLLGGILLAAGAAPGDFAPNPRPSAP